MLTQIKQNFINKQSFSLKSFQILILILVIIGIFFRFANLDQKVYWGDETSTSSRIAGYTFAEIRENFSGTYAVNLEGLNKYQQLIPERTYLDVVKGLAAEEPQLPPVYFSSLRAWVQLFGSSITAIRSFSAVISLLALPGIYWLCRELFTSSTPAWIAVALIAISPFHLAYAQEARPQSLWTVTIILSSAALLRAVRLNTRWSWGVYTATLVLSLYTYLFSVLVAIGHGIYIFLNEGWRLSKTVRAYLMAVVTGGLLTVPWVMTTFSSFTQLDAGTSWVKMKVPLGDLVKAWLLFVNRLFIDFNYNFTYRHNLLYFGIAATIILVGYAIYFLCRHTPKRTWSFILLLISITFLALALPDLITGGRRSGVARYLIPSFLGIQLTVAYLLAAKLSLNSQKFWHQQIWKIVMVCLLSVGVVSGSVYSQSRTWWNKYNSVPFPEIADILREYPHPVLIGSPPLELIYLMDTDLKIQSSQNAIPDGTNDVFIISRNYSELILEKVLQEQPDYILKNSHVW